MHEVDPFKLIHEGAGSLTRRQRRGFEHPYLDELPAVEGLRKRVDRGRRNPFLADVYDGRKMMCFGPKTSAMF